MPHASGIGSCVMLGVGGSENGGAGRVLWRGRCHSVPYRVVHATRTVRVRPVVLFPMNGIYLYVAYLWLEFVWKWVLSKSSLEKEGYIQMDLGMFCKFILKYS